MKVKLTDNERSVNKFGTYRYASFYKSASFNAARRESHNDYSPHYSRRGMSPRNRAKQPALPEFPEGDTSSRAFSPRNSVGHVKETNTMRLRARDEDARAHFGVLAQVKNPRAENGGCFAGVRSAVTNFFQDCLAAGERQHYPASSSRFRQRIQTDNERRKQDCYKRVMCAGKFSSEAGTFGDLYTFDERTRDSHVSPPYPDDDDYDRFSSHHDDEVEPEEEETLRQHEQQHGRRSWSEAQCCVPSPSEVYRNTMCMNHYSTLPVPSPQDFVRRNSCVLDLLSAEDRVCELCDKRTPETKAQFQSLLSLFSRVNRETMSRGPSLDCGTSVASFTHLHAGAPAHSNSGTTSLSSGGHNKWKCNATQSTEEPEATDREWEWEHEYPPSIACSTASLGGNESDGHPVVYRRCDSTPTGFRPMSSGYKYHPPHSSSSPTEESAFREEEEEEDAQVEVDDEKWSCGRTTRYEDDDAIMILDSSVATSGCEEDGPIAPCRSYHPSTVVDSSVPFPVRQITV